MALFDGGRYEQQRGGGVWVMDEEERLGRCREIAEHMYIAGLGDHYDVIERLSRPEIDMKRIMSLLGSDVVAGIVSGIRSNHFPHRSRLTAWRRG